jgi:exodeoxyribonuclease-3
VKIATFNINGTAARLPRLLEWLAASQPDVAGLQEIKCVDETFPRAAIEALGYGVETHGQKGFNGVALLSRLPMQDVMRGLPGDLTDEQSRYIEATIAGVRIGCLYLPNGNPQPGPKFDYKLAWMDRLIAHAQTLLETEQPVILLGDYNVCPQDVDCFDVRAMAQDALLQPESRARFQTLLHLGYWDAIRALQPAGRAYTYWDYQAGAWPKDHGLRIDHLLLSPQAADRLEDAGIERAVRAKEKASDHTPVWVKLAA